MRALRTLLVAGLALVPAVATAPSAAADGGGAYLNFDRTYYAPGSRGVARTSVAIPRSARAVLGDGPFYAFLVTGRTWPSTDAPLPADLVRIGTFEVLHRTGARFDLVLRFTTPDVPGDAYWITLCNDPCTVNGFSLPVMGTMSIVQTRREEELLRLVRHEQAQLGLLHGRLRTATRLAAADDAQLGALRHDDARTNARVRELTAELRRARRPRSLDGPAVAVCVGLLLAAIAITLAGRRRRPSRARPAPFEPPPAATSPVGLPVPTAMRARSDILARR